MKLNSSLQNAYLTKDEMVISTKRSVLCLKNIQNLSESNWKSFPSILVQEIFTSKEQNGHLLGFTFVLILAYWGYLFWQPLRPQHTSVWTHHTSVITWMYVYFPSGNIVLCPTFFSLLRLNNCTLHILLNLDSTSDVAETPAGGWKTGADAGHVTDWGPETEHFPITASRFTCWNE